MTITREPRLCFVVASVLLAAGCSGGRPATERFSADLKPPGPVAEGPLPAVPAGRLGAKRTAVQPPAAATPAPAEAWSPAARRNAEAKAIASVHVLRPEYPPISPYIPARHAVLERVFLVDREGRWWLTPLLSKPGDSLAEQHLDPASLSLACNAGTMTADGLLGVETPDPVLVAKEGFAVTVGLAGGKTVSSFIIPPTFADLIRHDITPATPPQTPAGRAGKAGQAGAQGEHGANGDSGRTGNNGNTGGDGGDGSSGRNGANGRRGAAGRRAEDGEPGKPGRRGADAPPVTVEVAPLASPFSQKPLLVYALVIGTERQQRVIPWDQPLELIARGGKGAQGADGGAGGPGGKGGNGGNGGNGGSGGSGGNGGSGQQGARGYNGGTGQSGGPGGNGGPGGRGGNGGDAGSGGDSGDGNNGGDGGRGGNAGDGGDGGDGPPLKVVASDEAVLAAVHGWRIVVSGGDGGDPGRPGAGGPGGAAGLPGKVGQPGQPGSGGSGGAGGPGGAGGAAGPVQVQVSNDGSLAGMFANAMASAAVQSVLAGADGSQGPAGAPGSPGQKGESGRSGQAGDPGHEGAAGEAGKVGKPGKPGLVDLPGQAPTP